MARLFVSLTFLLCWASVANATGEGDSIANARHALGEVLTHISDASQNADDFFQTRLQRCDASLHSLEASGDSLANLNSDLVEFEAAAQKAAAASQDVQTPSAQSTHGRLGATLPTLAIEKAGVAETKRLTTDRQQSVASGKAVVAALRLDCDRAAGRGETMAAAYATGAFAIQAAVRSFNLHFAGPEADKDAPPEDSGVDASMEVDVDEDEAGTQSERPASFLQWQWASFLRWTGGMTPAKWCSEEQRRAENALNLAQESAIPSPAEAASRPDIEAHLAEQLRTVEASATALGVAVEESANGTIQENALSAKYVEDGQIVIQTLGRMISFFKKLHGAEGASDVAVKLKSAKSVFETQAQAAGNNSEAGSTLRALKVRAGDATHALDRERADIEVVRSERRAQREQSSISQTSHKAEVANAMLYLNKLRDECALQASAQEERERAVQTHAIEDEQSVLLGKQLRHGTTGSSSGSIRGSLAKKSMSPLERAAARMGVLDGN